MRLMFVGVALLLAACGGGGGGGTSTPTAPAPIPALDACNALGGASVSVGTSILNGAECTNPSPVVLMNMRDASGGSIGACSGTLVTRRHILTAAHCVDQDNDLNVPISTVRIWLGSGDQIDAASFVHYPNYRFNQSGFDVAVVAMGEDLPRTPVPILTGRDGRNGETAIIIGWGRDQNLAGARLRAGSTTLSAVRNGFLETIFAPPSSSVCQGDSGGPILLQEGGAWLIAGITSAISANVCNDGTNFYQSVRQGDVLNFIRQHVPGVGER
jgi:secreted trypsin-like serine protease